MKELRKELECLYAWCEFYGKNQQWTNMDKCQAQIEDFKLKHDL